MPVQKTFWEDFWLPKVCLQIMGIIELNGRQTGWKTLLSKILVGLPLFAANWVLYAEINCLLYQDPNTDEMIRLMLSIIPDLVIQCRTIIVILNRARLGRLFKICEDLWNNSSPEDYAKLKHWAKRTNVISNIYVVSSQMISTSFVVVAVIRQLSTPNDGVRGRYTVYSVKERFTPSPWYEIDFAMQAISNNYMTLCLATYDMYGAVLVLNMCGQLELVKEWLLDISKESSDASNLEFDENVKSAMDKAITRHQVVMEFCEILEEVVQYANLIQLLDGLYVMAFTASRIMMSEEFGYKIWYASAAVYVTGWILVLCWPAEALSNSCSDIATAIYETPWYNFSKRDKKTMAIVLARSQRPVILTAGKFVNLSMETFSAVVSNGISIYLVLSNF